MFSYIAYYNIVTLAFINSQENQNVEKSSFLEVLGTLVLKIKYDFVKIFIIKSYQNNK